MKKQDKHPIDNFFRENTEQHFPYDPALWNKADRGIAAYFGRKYIIILSAIFLIFFTSIALFFAFDGEDKSGKITMSKNSGNKISENQNKNEKSYYLQAIREEEICEIDTENTDENNTSKINNPSSENDTEKLIFKRNDESVVTERSPVFNQKENKPEDSNKISIEQKAPEQKSVEEMTADIEPEPEVQTPEKKKANYEDFVISSKPFNSFSFDPFMVNKISDYATQNPEKKRRKYALTLEFENKISTNVKHQLSGLPQNELEYRKQHEKIKNSTAYSLNIMFQRGGFGVITGLGHKQAAIKTNYTGTAISYEYTTRYIMLREKVPYQGGFFSDIREINDTIARHSEEVPLNGQAEENVFQWLQIPLKISYQYPYKRFRFSGRIGTDIMWLYNKKGSFINSTLDGLTAIGEDQHKLNRINVNASGQILAGYQFNKRIQVGGSLYYDRQLRSNMSNYESRFHSTGFGWYVRCSL